MLKRTVLSVVIGTLLVVTLLPDALPQAAAQTKGKAKGKATPKAGPKRTAPAGPFAVQARSRKTRKLRTTSADRARAAAVKWRALGLNVAAARRGNTYHVTASLRRWKTMAVVPTHGIAVGKARVLRNQGFATRVHAAKKR